MFSEYGVHLAQLSVDVNGALPIRQVLYSIAVSDNTNNTIIVELHNIMIGFGSCLNFVRLSS